jgi:Erv1 / Alr family
MSQKVFKEEHYNSGDGMLTTVWGPGMWHSLHCISFNYPIKPTQKQKRHYMNFVLNLKNVLPCGKCRKNLVKNFKKLPLTIKDMESRATFSLYIYKLHELINKMLGKNSGLSYEDVRERYENFRSRCTKTYKEMVLLKKKNKTVKKKKHEKNEEKGCTEPLYGDKSKCILKIVPQETPCETFQMDKSCIKRTL